MSPFGLLSGPPLGTLWARPATPRTYPTQMVCGTMGRAGGVMDYMLYYILRDELGDYIVGEIRSGVWDVEVG